MSTGHELNSILYVWNFPNETTSITGSVQTPNKQNQVNNGMNLVY